MTHAQHIELAVSRPILLILLNSGLDRTQRQDYNASVRFNWYFNFNEGYEYYIKHLQQYFEMPMVSFKKLKCLYNFYIM